MGNNVLFTTVLNTIQKDIQLPEAAINKVENVDLDTLRTYLTEIIRELLDRDFNRLMQAMYRIDIPEENFINALNAKNPNEIPAEIANLVINREMQKVESRKKYP